MSDRLGERSGFDFDFDTTQTDPSGGVDNTKPSSQKQINETQQDIDTADVIETNPLHDFAPYNYNITLSCISKDDFNNGNDTGGVVIAKSSGKGTTGPSPLDKDFYIDNLVIRNTVSPTKQGGLGTVYQVLFEVTEPFGTSFVDALILAADQQKYTNHLKAVYLLTIDFFGINDEGKPSPAPISGTSREIPIHIYEVNFNVEAGVTTYAIQAVPATMLAFTDLHGRTKEAYTVTGNTVEEVLNNFFGAITRTQASFKTIGVVDHADEYELDVSQSTNIVKTKIGYDKLKNDSKNIFNYSNLKSAPGRSQRAITIPKDTSIQSFIEALVRESAFYRDQFYPDLIPKEDKLFVMRLFTQLQLKEIDNGNNRPQYLFKYILREQEVTSAYFTKTASAFDKNYKSVRAYDYLYTGKNADVLQFDITYSFAFYEAIQYTAKDNDEETSNIDGQSSEANNNQKGGAGQGVTQVTKEPENSKYNDAFQLSVNKENGEIGRIFQQIIEDPSADLLVTTMEIIGDPLWISQKGVTNKSFRDSYVEGSPNVDDNGAIIGDDSEVYIDFNFKTPEDLNDDTGLFFNDKRSSFSGKYKVFLCANRFSGGVYTNELEMVRMRFQEEDVNGPTVETGEITVEESTTTLALGGDITQETDNTTGNIIITNLNADTSLPAQLQPLSEVGKGGPDPNNLFSPNPKTILENDLNRLLQEREKSRLD